MVFYGQLLVIAFISLIILNLVYVCISCKMEAMLRLLRDKAGESEDQEGSDETRRELEEVC